MINAQGLGQITIGINASFARKPETGIGQVTLNFIKTLATLQAAQKKTRVILYLEQDLPKEMKLPENFEKRVFRPLWRRDDLIRKVWWEKYLLPKKVKKDGCQVFLSLYQNPTIMESENLKHIMVVHDIIPRFFPDSLNNFRKRKYWDLTEEAIRRADKIIAISKRTEKDIIEQLNIPAEKITVNYLDVDEAYKKRVGEAKALGILLKNELEPGYILAGGGYEARKNVEGVIHAYKYLSEKNKAEHFISRLPKLAIYGKLLPQLAPLVTDAEKLVKELNLTGKVKLLGMVPQKDLPAIFQNAKMFVYPSRYEGFGMPILEAMNSGLPVIAGKAASIPEVGGDSVLYCDPEDVRDIAMVMKNLLIKKDLRETLKRRGPERAKIFGWEKFTRKVLNISAEMLKKPVLS